MRARFQSFPIVGTALVYGINPVKVPGCEVADPERIYFKMNRASIYVAALVGAVLLAGCQTIPPGAERGPHGTMAYDVLIEASPPGARIEANGQVVGNTPCI